MGLEVGQQREGKGGGGGEVEQGGERGLLFVMREGVPWGGGWGAGSKGVKYKRRSCILRDKIPTVRPRAGGGGDGWSARLAGPGAAYMVLDRLTRTR